MMRLLWFNPATDETDPILGFATKWIEVVAKQVEMIHVITLREGIFNFPKNIKVYSVGKEKRFCKSRRVFNFYNTLINILDKENIDACFSHMIPIFSILAAPMLRLRGIPIATWYAHPSLSWTLRFAHHLSNRVVTSFLTTYPYKHCKLEVIGQGIDTDLYKPDDKFPENPPIILCAGRISPVKDHPTLLMAIKVLKGILDYPIKVVILGDPAGASDQAYLKELQRLAKILDINQIIRFCPSASREELFKWYRRCTVHINLTKTGSGDKVALEAMACGRPSVVANFGFRETVGGWSSRLSFSFGDFIELAERIHWILSNPQEILDSIGNDLRRQILRNHSLDNLGKRLVGLLESLKTFPEQKELYEKTTYNYNWNGKIRN